MQERLPIDSRDYMLAFELRSIDDCPPDFELPSSMAGFDAGLFLPRGDRDWLGQPLYPPRILLLKGGWLHIVSHPSTGDLPRRCAIEQIASVESGQMLLKGWLRFTGSGFDCTVGYNTLGSAASRTGPRYQIRQRPGAGVGLRRSGFAEGIPTAWRGRIPKLAPVAPPPYSG